MDAPASLFLEDFGQKVDLTRRIREVLLNYPEGTTVLKELIQNADDAGATKVSFCLDRRVHGVQSLLSENLAQWQGPALLAYNDAEFTEEDFVSISRIGGSSKIGQAWKTGRFGVGFNSVYHLTDMPSFVSSKYVVLFDPQGVYLPEVSTANPGKRIEFVNSSAISLYEDQFFPYCAFGCDMKKPFLGTLFRFPLRNADQAACSKLSRQVYSEDEISSMFSQLYVEGILTLLFLKTVLSIEMHIWDAGALKPRKLYSCAVSPVNEDIVWHRKTLLRLTKSMNSPNSGMDSFTLNFLSEAMMGTHLEQKTDTYYIVQTMASASSKIGSFATAASKEYDVNLLPWASIAACISNNTSDNGTFKLGQAFCSLPLPVRTGMAVQINGYFEVSSNRRGIWYGADMDRSGKMRCVWNRLLLEEVVTPTFTQLLLGLRSLLGPTSLYYSLWPSGTFEEPWNILVDSIYKNVGTSPLLYSDIDGGKWVLPVDCFLHDKEFNKSKELGEALVQLGMPIVHLSNILCNMLLNSACGFHQKVVTPDNVRNFLRECKALGTLNRSYKLILLEYCLEDLVDTDIGKCAHSLPLLPLSSGGFGLFSEAMNEISYFICSDLEFSLLQQVSDRVVDRNIPLNVYKRLSAIALSSKTNLVIFNMQCLLQLFSRFVPAEWKYKSKVSWDPESGGNHPSSAWFVLFWKYLQNHCEKLSVLSDWPILPSTSGHLYRASKQSKLINAEKLSKKLQDLLVTIGCRTLNCTYGVEHPELSYFVSDADAAGVLESINDAISSTGGNMQTLFHNVGSEERDELRTFLLEPKWYMGNSMNDSNILYCKRLPIYRVYAEGSSQIHTFSDLEYPRKYIPPLGVLNCLLGGDFINSSSVSEEDILLRYFGIQRMGKARFYRQHVLERVREVQPEFCDSIMLSVLQDLPQLCIEDTSFREYLRNLEFIPTLSGSTKCPAVLYDPRVEELYALLDDSDSFPFGVFQESGVLDMLQGLGLRTYVSSETVIQSARQVERLMRTDEQKAYSKGKVLLSYLEVNANRWTADSLSDNQGAVNRMFARATTAFRPRNLTSDLDKFWNDLRMICWCPVLVSAPFKALPWPIATSLVAPPKLVRLQRDLWLVSASMRVLDAECSSTALSYHLGWSAPPGGSVISAQLLELGKNNEIVNDQVLRQELAVAMPRIYSILTSLIGSDEIDIVKAVLEGCRWIWVGDGFATADEVVLSGPLHLAPYIRVIPVDLAVFRELFLELGIREFLKPCDYGDILCRMATRKGSTPLDAQEIRAAILIVQHLAEIQPQGHEIKIYLPDLSGTLVLAGDLVYNDAPWFLGSEDPNSPFSGKSTVVLTSKRTAQKFVHGNISNDVAERLGVCSLRRTLLAESSDSMNLSLSGAAEAFGQHEALTTRLRHILEMYADGPGILFELVQNAEDAGASEVIFLLDKTQYGTSSVLSPEMADWQGPALYCFNDSVFSSQDLYAISRIGQESKLENPLAIGRFGLGFNCVYHFTDVPTFVSGENIVFFDPHACNLPGISPSHPGLRIKFAGRRISEQFPDQFSPYLHFGCDLLHTFPGTLFRFPLRSASAASRSQIKKEAYTSEDVVSLFSSFSEVVSEALLFLRNVKTISIFVKEGTGHEMQLVHRVNKHCSAQSEVESNEVHNMFKFLKGNQHNGIGRDQFLNKLTKSIGKDLPSRCQKILVTEQRSSGTMCHFWITSECVGSGLATNSSPASHDKGPYFIPWACTAAYINSVKVVGNMSCIQTFEDFCVLTPDTTQVSTASFHDRREFDGRAFCFLPLPITTGLPAHVNAYFELSSNRRDIWFGNDMAGGGKKRSDWNIYLLEDVAAPAYGHLLEKVASEIGPCDLFFSLWPTTMGSEPWASMVRKLYIFISKFGLRVFFTKARGGQWISAKQAVLPDLTFHKAHELVEALSDAGLPLVTVTVPLMQILIDVCPALHFLTAKLLRTLLIRRKREFKDRDAMILTLEYCLLDIRKPVQCDDLYGLPLIPLADGSFTAFEKKGLSERIYIARADEYGLLKDAIPLQLVDNRIPEVVHVKLCDVAECEESNISFLTCPLLENLFFRLLPAEWKHSKQVTWVPGHRNQPSLDWIRLLWAYLSSSCDDLSVFNKWPILPVQNNYLLQLVYNSNVIQDDGWSENMSSLLLKVGCLFLRNDLPIEHPQLKNYVQSPTATGLLNALLAIAGKPENIEVIFTNAVKPELNELRSFILQSKWFCENQMDDIHVNIIKQLPIFESYKSRQLVSLGKTIRWIKPSGVQEDLLDDSFIYAESEKERIILRDYLGIREPSIVEFYRENVLNRMSDFLLVEGAILAILQDVKHLIENDMSMKTVMSMTPFVLAADGSWKAPSSLYDPRVPELQAVLHRDIFFPSDKFLDSEALETLVSLGLRRSLSFTALLDCAMSVSVLHKSGDSETLSYGKKLLLCLDALALKLATVEQETNSANLTSTLFIQNDSLADHTTECVENTEISENYLKEDLDFSSLVSNLIEDKPEHEFWSDIRAIVWCPVYGDTPLQGLPWLRSTDQVAAPSNVRPKSQMMIVSSSMHILSGDCSVYLQSKLGWTDRVKIEVLSAQLIELSKYYCQQKLNALVEPVFETAVQEAIPMLYSHMKEYIGTDDFLILKTALNSVSWVWIGDDFVSPNVLAFDSPVKYTPYLYVVPSELSEYKDLLLSMGAKLSFDILDYFQVLRRLKNDIAGVPLSTEQLSFVLCVLEAIADCATDKPLVEISNTTLLVPDSSGILVYAGDLVYNDAPWMDANTLVGKRFIHPNISNHLANRLGIQSLRCLSLVNEEMTKNLPCMDSGRIKDLMAMYGNNEFLLYDLLELADCCKAKKLHLIFDKREHPRQSLMQHNLGDFQGPALVAILEGASLSREEISSLQLLPPWKLRGNTLSYGLGLFSCYFICDVQSIVSGGYYYIFDPHGLAFSVTSASAPAAKVFSLIGTNLAERFHDQFNPMLIGENMPWSSTDSTIIRMPLSSECMKDGLVIGLNKIKQICDSFMKHSSRALLFLKSVVQVSISTWEEGNLLPGQDYSVSIDSSAPITRNPFSEKNWRKFHISRLFSSSNAACKFNVIDLNLCLQGSKFVDRWLVVLSLGSGQTRNMALDRRYLAYNLTPVAGVAACISRNGHPSESYSSNSIMSPLPLSGGISMPVTVLGCFLVCHDGGRYLFKDQESEALSHARYDAGNQLIEAWNRELMSCVRDSYIEMVLELHKLRKEPSSSTIEARAGRAISQVLKSYEDQIYSFWPRSNVYDTIKQRGDGRDFISTKVIKADWECLIEQVIRPFYVHVADLPVWQLYSGNLVKAVEGMFLSPPKNDMTGNVLPATVCSFVKEHYPVFSTPWEFVSEVQAVGLTIQEVKPKMVRDLLRKSSSSIILRSVDTFVDVLEYCLSDIQISESSTMNAADISEDLGNLNSISRAREESNSSSGSISSIRRLHGMSSQKTASSGEALEMMTSLGKALFDFGRGVVEDIGRAGGPLAQMNSNTIGRNNIRVEDHKLILVAAELKGLPCPTATEYLTRLGGTELWCGNIEQQTLMSPLAVKFIHPKIFDRPVLADIFSNSILQKLLKVQSFSFHLLADNMRLLFHDSWVNHVMHSNMAPWFSWDNTKSSGGEVGPSHEWIRLFWRSFSGSSEDLSLFSNWPLIPAFIGRQVLCRVKEHHLIFIPPTVMDSTSEVQPYISAFKEVEDRYPWLLSLMNQCSIPIFDTNFIDCAAPSNCLPTPGQSLSQVIASKLVAAKAAGYLPELITSFPMADCDELFALFASDFSSHESSYGREEIEVLRALPIYKTSIGSYTRLQSQDMCMISSNSFLQPSDEHCLSYSTDSIGRYFLRALGVLEYNDEQILVKFGLPGFEDKPQTDQEDILIYIYMNWQDLQVDSSIVDALKETKFVRNADEFSMDLSKPKDLFDPGDALLQSVFLGERKKFPGERFTADGWLRILKKTGLRNATEVDVVLECARRVEFLGIEAMKTLGDKDYFETESSNSQNEVSLEIWSLARSVVESIFTNFAVLYSNNFCNLLGKIECVPAEKGFPSYNGRASGLRVLCSYSEAVLVKDWPLAWSCAPILSRQSIVPPEYSWGALQLRSPPAFSTVLKHLQVIGRSGGEDTFAHWPTASGMITIDEAFVEVLKYLEKVWGSLSASDIAELQRVAFIPAANCTRLVTVSSLFVRLTINLSPFAFELPSPYLPFVRILKNLGLQDLLTLASAKDILSSLQQACGYQRLNPNELRAVIEILYFICDKVTEANNLDDSNWETEAVVPDDSCRLVHAKACVYVDSYGSRYIKSIDTSRLRFIHPDLPERICMTLAIRKLSDVVVEELDREDQMETLQLIGSVQLEDIRKKLLSKSLQAAVWIVIKSTISYVPSLKNLSLETLQNSLNCIAENLKFVRCLNTRFLLLPKSLDITHVNKKHVIPEWENDNKYRTLYFVSRSKTSIFVAEPPSFMSVLDVIAIVVSHVLGSPTPLPIGSLFMCPEDSEVTVIESLKLCSERRETDLVGQSISLVGKEILPQDALQVQILPLRPFYSGEIVAWRAQNGEKLKYGRVPEDMRPSAGQGLYRFKVEISPGETMYLISSNVFSFKSVSMAGETSSTAMQLEGSSHAVTKNRMHIQAPENPTKGTSKPSKSSDLQYGQVSAAELVQAVHEMLSAAGINMGIEKQSLLETTLTLQEQCKESQAALLLEQEKADVASKEADAAKAAWTCRVCLSSEVDITLDPCGHVLCRRCSSAVSRCPFCRIQVSKTIRMYRP